MLVGVLTMAVIGGAALVEKAKIQKVIEDIEYYEKAVRNFTIQFGNLPGNLTIKRCNENIDIFKVCKSKKWGALNLGDTTYVGTSGMFDSYITFTPFPFMQMEKAGFIKGKVMKDLEKGAEKVNGQNPQQHPRYRVPYDFLNWYGGKLSFDKEGRAMFDGSTKGLAKEDKCFQELRGSYKVDTYLGARRGGKQHMHTMAMMFIRNQPKKLDRTNGNGKGASGLLSADMMHKIDKKIDDGRPKDGRIQALKIDNGIDPVKNNKTICYNNSWEQRETATVKASYVKTKNLKRGCNLIYYLPDYSGYLY